MSMKKETERNVPAQAEEGKHTDLDVQEIDFDEICDDVSGGNCGSGCAEPPPPEPPVLHQM